MDNSYYKLTKLGELREQIAKASYEKLMQDIFHIKGDTWRKWEDMDSKSKKLHYKFADGIMELIKPLLDSIEPSPIVELKNDRTIEVK